MRPTFDSDVFVSALNLPTTAVTSSGITGNAFDLQLSDEILEETTRILAKKFRWPTEDIVQVRDVLSLLSQRVIPLSSLR